LDKIDEKSTVLPELREVANSFWGYFVFNRRMGIMIGLIFLFTGLYSFNKMPLESEPEIKVPYGLVMTTYQGASPKEVAEQVTFKIEQKIKSLEDLKKMTSTSSEGISQIFVEFDAKADIDDSIRKLKDKVDEATPNLPDDADDPIAQELSFSNRPIITLGFFGDIPYERLLNVVEDIQDELEKVKGIQSANIVGERKKHVLVAVRERDMMQYGMSLRAIGQSIRSFHMNSPIGNIEIDELYYRIRIEADQDTVDRVKNIPIMTKNGATIYVKDVANVKEELREATTKSLVSVNGQPSKQAISINIVKKTGDNIVETVDKAKEIIEEMKIEGTIPKEVEYLGINDMGEYVIEDFNRLMTNALQTVIIIFIILFIALGFKEALIGGIAIPFTFLVAFTYLHQTGNTFNFLVLFSLILGLGLLVDTTIVMMEGMHEHLYKDKLTPINAALKTIKTYRFPLMSGMLTTIAAFTPMLMMSGMMGQFFKFIPITVDIVLISAFFVGLLIIPGYAVLFMHRVKKGEKELKIFRQLREKRKEVISIINKKYEKLLHDLLEHKKTRRKLYFICIGAFISALMLPILGFVKVEGFPLVDIDFMFIETKAPVGTSLEKLEPIVNKIEKRVQQDPNIESYVLNMGMGGSESLEGDLAPGSTNTHLATMSINFVDKDDRTMRSYEIAEAYKQEMKLITEADVTVPELRSGPPTGAAIQVLIFGEDHAVLTDISNKVQKELKGWGAQDVKDDMSTGTAEFTFNFNGTYEKSLLKNYGLSVTDVAQEARMAVYPSKVASIKRGDEEIDINVQNDWGSYYPSSIDDVKNIQIQNNSGKYISLGAITTPQIGASYNSIKHVDGDQAITVHANAGKDQVPGDILNNLTPYLQNYDWPKGYSYEIAGGNDETMQSFEDLLRAMIIGLLLILLILISQFNSFKQPFVILMSLPLSMIGVLYGFFLLGLNIGVATMIGIVALSGIVINDAIVLIDRINTNRRERKMGLKEAIKEAGPARLQPIIITSITTILGILPVSLTDPFWLSLGMAIVFGMMFSTILTLVIIPSIYYSLESESSGTTIKKKRRYIKKILS